jgi:hypothetical protein
VVLPGYESVEVGNGDSKESLEIESPFETLIDESEIEYPQVEEVEINEVLTEPEIPQVENATQLVSGENIESKSEEELEESNKQLDLTKKSVAEKMFRAIEQDFDTLKYQFEKSERRTTRGLLIAYVIIAILLALLIFSFFKFSSDINTLNNEVKDLKKKVTSSLYDEQKSSPDYYFFS